MSKNTQNYKNDIGKKKKKNNGLPPISYWDIQYLNIHFQRFADRRWEMTWIVLLTNKKNSTAFPHKEINWIKTVPQSLSLFHKTTVILETSIFLLKNPIVFNNIFIYYKN